MKIIFLNKVRKFLKNYKFIFVRFFKEGYPATIKVRKKEIEKITKTLKNGISFGKQTIE